MTTRYVAYDPKRNYKLKTDAFNVVVSRASMAHYQVPAAAAIVASNAAVHADVTLADGATTVVTTAITNPATPRALRIKGNAAGIVGNVVIEGTNYNGDAISETIIAADAGAVDGNKAFKTVTKITFPARTAPGDKISVGFNEKLGLPYKLTNNTVTLVYKDNTKEANAATIAVDSTALCNNTIDLDSALNGKILDIYFIVN